MKKRSLVSRLDEWTQKGAEMDRLRNLTRKTVTLKNLKDRTGPIEISPKRRIIELTETDIETALQGELLGKLEEKGIEKREFLQEIKKKASERNIEISEDMIENIGNLILLIGKKMVEEE